MPYVIFSRHRPPPAHGRNAATPRTRIDEARVRGGGASPGLSHAGSLESRFGVTGGAPALDARMAALLAPGQRPSRARLDNVRFEFFKKTKLC